MVEKESHQSAEFDDPLVKLFVELEPTDWHDYRTESLWAKPMGGDLYEIRNVPFYAMGLSYEDVVRAALVGGDLLFKAVERRSGHSSYRCLTMTDIADEQWLPYWKPLEDLGCTYERGTARLFAVDVPARVDVRRAYELLEAGEKAGVWGFQEAHCGHLPPS